MNRLQAITPLILMLAALGCSAEQESAHPASATVGPEQSAEAGADRVAQRPQLQTETRPTTTDLPLWPQAAQLAPPPDIISPPNVPPAVPAAPPWSGGPAAASNSASPVVPPLPPLLPTFPTADPPLPQPAPGDENPLRGSTPESAPITPQLPRIPAVPALPTLPLAPPTGNPLRSADAGPFLPAAPGGAGSLEAIARWNQMNATQTAPSPIGSGAPAAPITSLSQLPKPFLPPNDQRVESVPLLPHAPTDSAPADVAPNPPAPAPRTVQQMGEAMTKTTPSRLPRVSIYNSPKAVAENSPAARAPLARATMAPATMIPEGYNPSGGAAPPKASASPRMLSMGTRSVETPFVNVPPGSESTSPPATASPPLLPLPPAAVAPPNAGAAPADDVPFTLPTSPPSPASAAPSPGLVEPTFEPAGSVPEGALPSAAPASEVPPFPMLPAEALPGDALPEADPTALAPPEPAPDKSVAIPVAIKADNEPYEIVRVFYGTDRRPILESEDTLWMRVVRFLPAGFLLALSGVGIGVVLASRKITWIIGTSALVVLSALAIWHGVGETIAIAEQAALEEPKYSAEKSDRGRIERGICEVSIPKSHVPGELEGPARYRFERVDLDKHITLRKTTRLQDEAFYEQIRQQVASSPDKEILVFVHGFNVSFEDAARRTGQMAKDLEMKGAPVFYSWPADKYFLLTYGKDSSSVGWSASHLREFLLDLVHQTDAQSINLVAHSMGNRALTTALREIDLQLKDEARLFNQVVLAAPDIDADDFRDNIAPAIQRTAKQVTLYASSHDVALGASRFLHRNPRAGDTSRGLVVVPGIHTIDVSNIDGGPWGHSYYGASDPVLRDLHLLLTSLPPERRTWLNMKELDGQTYWAFKPLGTARTPALVEPR